MSGIEPGTPLNTGLHAGRLIWKVRQGGYRQERVRFPASTPISQTGGLGVERAVGWFSSSTPVAQADGFRRVVDCLVANDGPPKYREYDPLSDTPRLYREFAGLTAADVLGFANAHGLLGVEVVTADGDRAEPLPVWMDEVYSAHRVLRIWDFVNGRLPQSEYDVIVSPKALNGIKKFAADDWHYCEYQSSWWRKVREWGRAEILQILNDRFTRHGSIRLQLVLVGDRFRRTATPQTLIGAIWHQIAAAVTDTRDFFLCPVCQENWVERGGQGRPQVFCGVRCKSKDQKQKTKVVKSLQAAGATVEAIADRLDRKPASVDRMLKTMRKSRGASRQRVKKGIR